MSISINPYASNNYYLNQTQTNKVSSKQDTYAQSLGDMLQLSGSYQTYTDGTPVAYTKDGNDSSSPLSMDDKKNYLTNLQTYLNSANLSSSSSTSDRFMQTLSSMKDSLSSFDPTNATDDQVNNLYQQTVQTVDSARPKHHHHKNDLSSIMNSILASDNSNSVDDMKSLLSTLSDKLSASSTNSTTSTSNATSVSNPSDLKTTLQTILSGTDLSTSSDTQIQDLFSQVLDAIKNSVNQQQGGNDQNSNAVQAESQVFTQPVYPVFNLNPTTSLNTQQSNTTSNQSVE